MRSVSENVGLRERKKASTRLAIQQAAMRLFAKQGYAATTVEQIAEAAEVSPSTFFRYFRGKEDLLLTDEYDPMIAAAFRAQPPSVTPVQALRKAIKAVYGQMSEEDLAAERDRGRLIQSTPAGGQVHAEADAGQRAGERPPPQVVRRAGARHRRGAEDGRQGAGVSGKGLSLLSARPFAGRSANCHLRLQCWGHHSRRQAGGRRCSPPTS